MKQIKYVDEDLQSEYDINAFVEKLIQIRIPLDRPQFEIHFVENYNATQSIIMMKHHHVFGDGISG